MPQDELPQILSDEEFAALLKQREQFDRPEHERWNNAGPRSQPVTTDGKPESSLEQQFPHIAQKLTSVWPSEACALYLKELVVTERNTRQGFPADVVEDLLMLYAINEILLRRRGPAPAPAGSPNDPWPTGDRTLR